MTNRFTTISAAAALALAALTVSASADEAGTIHAAKTTGAMRIESGALPTSYAGVQRQGGFAMPTGVRWTTAPAEVLTTGSIDTAGTGRWMSGPAR